MFFLIKKATENHDDSDFAFHFQAIPTFTFTTLVSEARTEMSS